MSKIKPSKQDAIEAIKILIDYIGDSSDRLDLRDTPERVIKSYSELFKGYSQNASDVLQKHCVDTANFQDIVLLKNIYFTSCCEHHMLPIIGNVSIAYIPNKKIVGISKLVRVVEVFSRRLQLQERMTKQISDALEDNLSPLGVAVRVSAKHCCMSLRGVRQENNEMVTTCFAGQFKENASSRTEFINLIKD
jgi:GTP cyclohydrolase I